MNLTAYVHDLDPVIWQVTDSIALRWYGVAYLMGFIGGYFLLSWLSRRKLHSFHSHTTDRKGFPRH